MKLQTVIQITLGGVLLFTNGCQHKSSSFKIWPVERAEVDAKRDVAAGKYMLIYAGMPWATYWAEREILMQEYNIELITTCDAEYTHYGERYTKVSLLALEQRFGTNLLAVIKKRAEMVIAK